jgi:dolichyl-phosphate-mannose-protein mannosyltransferase
MKIAVLPADGAALVERDQVRSSVYLLMLSFAAIYFLAWPIWRAHLLIEIWPTEAWNAYLQDAAASGQRLYPAPDSLVGNNYPPLSFYAIGYVGRIFGDNLFVGRALSLFSLAALGIEIFLSVRLLVADRTAAAVGALWYLAIMAHNSTTYVGINDPQIAGEAIMGAALVWFLARDRDGKTAIAPLLLMVAGGFWKHNIIGIPITAIAWLFINHGRRAIGPALISAATALAGLAACGAIFGPAFFVDLLATRQYALANVLTNVGHLQWTALAFAIWLAWALSDRRSLAARFTSLHVAVSLFACVLQWFGHGVGGNAEFDFILALGIGVGVTFAGIERLWFAKIFGAARARDAMILALVMRLLVSERQETALLVLSEQFRSEVAAGERNVIDDVAQVVGIPGDVSCTVKVVCRLAGKRFVHDEFKTEELVATGSATEADIAAMLASRGITPFVGLTPKGAPIDESIVRWLARR